MDWIFFYLSILELLCRTIDIRQPTDKETTFDGSMDTLVPPQSTKIAVNEPSPLSSSSPPDVVQHQSGIRKRSAELDRQTLDVDESMSSSGRTSPRYERIQSKCGQPWARLRQLAPQLLLSVAPPIKSASEMPDAEQNGIVFFFLLFV